MNPIYKFLTKRLSIITALFIMLISCNKDVEQFADITPAALSGTSLSSAIAANPKFSIYNELITKAGMVNTLNNMSGGYYTVLVPDNDAMTASGFSSAVVAAIPTATAAAIVNYNIIPQKMLSTSIAPAFPNMQLTTMVVMDPTNPLIRMTTFLSKNGTQYYANNIPLGTVDVSAANGVIHNPLRIVAPPSTTLKGAMATEADLSLFRAAVARGDQGQTGLNRFDSLFNYPVTNMTVLAPNNNAFKGLINALSGGAVPLNAPDATFIGFINTMIPADQVRGILAYHILASNSTGSYLPSIRVFSSDITSTPMFVKTMVNSSVSVHPGIMTQAGFTGPFVTSLKFTQYPPIAPSTTPFSATAANAVSMDKQGVNGVYHIIDRVLMPQ